MSVLSPVISTWDGENRRAYLAEGVSDFYPIEDIYHEYRNQRRLDETLRKFEPLLRAEGNVSKGAGAFTPRYVVLLDGFKIIPFDEVLQVNQLGDMITDDPDVDPTLYDTSSLTVPKVVYIKPSEAETIQLNSGAIEYSSYGGQVSLHSGSIYSGTDYPTGNMQYPVNNAPDAVSICDTKGFHKIGVYSDYNFILGDDISSKHISGVSHIVTNIDIGYDAVCDKTVFDNLILTGILDGDSEINKCVVDEGLVMFNGHIHDSGIGGTFYLAGSKPAKFVNCSMADMTKPVTIDCGGSGQDAIIDYYGIMTISNLTGANTVGVIMRGGIVTIDSTCTAGTIIIQGNFELTDNSGVGCTVIKSEKLMVHDDMAEIATTVLDNDAGCV